MKKTILIIPFLLIGLLVFSQKDINNYKYIVVPLEYDFLKSKDKYRVNTLTRYLFKQEGFITLFDAEQYPDDLMKDRCLALYVDVRKAKGGLLGTRLEILLNDCFGEEVYKSDIGISRQKDFKTAYSEALRKAFVSIEKLDYEFQPIAIEVKENNNATEIVDDKVVQKEESNEISLVKEEDKVFSDEVEDYDDLYYAQRIENGYQLVNSEPKVIMTLLDTSSSNIFLVKGKSAIVYKEDASWYYSENNGALGEKKQLNIKF